MGIITEEGNVATVTVVREEVRVDENEQNYQFVEVYRSEPVPTEAVRQVKTIDRVYPVGTLVNVGVGPELPENPYEGQVWIKI
jgi:hypothetical protein